MILHALYDYYERKAADPETALPPFGIERKPIPFLIEIDEQGRPIQILDTREGKEAKQFLVPQAVKKTSGVAANLLWDTAEYALGIDPRDKPERVAAQHAAFIDRVDGLPDTVANDPGIIAVRHFLASPDVEALSRMTAWAEILDSNPIVSFQLHGDTGPISERPNVLTALKNTQSAVADATCLITGEHQSIERLHPAIKGVWGAQSSGANVVSFNLDAFSSYGKTQSFNAPVGAKAAFAYTTALNHLLRKGSEQRVQVGDASTVFWAQRLVETGNSEFPDWEHLFSSAMTDSPKDDPDRNTRAVKALYTGLNKGFVDIPEAKTEFYVLGLAPNAARISVRFWHSGTVKEMAYRLKDYFDDIAMVHGPKEPPYLPLFRLLKSTAVQEKADNIPPNLGGDLMRAILEGLPYPRTFFAAAVERNRATQSVTYPRAAIIKGYLNRLNGHSESEELTVSLDRQNTSTAYRLGRLFALLEKAQEEANPGINATIRERYFGAASATPVSVFPTLLKLFNHHLAKLENKGRTVTLEKLAGEILDEVPPDLPPTLSLNDQGRFAVGYYHQRQDFFTKKTASDQGDN